MGFSPQFLEELRDRLTLSQVIGRRVKLQRRGREHLGLCPFHAEKTPSFTVNDDKGFFHCFGCGAHGDVVGFVMQGENVSFPEAVERLAGEAGMALPASSPLDARREDERSRCLAIMEKAALWFERQLAAAAGASARDYLAARGLDEDARRRFRLGFAPNARSALKDHLIGEGASEALLLEAGLTVRPEDGRAAYDRFRGRIIFPIADGRGRIIALGGRIMGEGEPKYLNSPETPLFAKGRVLYNLHHAAAAAREGREVVVAEGYVDVIALHQAGFAAAVAPLGTAITEDQIALLWRLAPEPILCLDGDEAGRRAAARAAERVTPMLKPGFSLRFATLPPGEDPDSLIRRLGPAAMREVLDQARPLAELLWTIETQDRPSDTPERRAAIRSGLLARVSRITERGVAEAYRQEMETRFDRAFGRKLPAYGSAPRRLRRWPGRGEPPAGGGEGTRTGTPHLMARRKERNAQRVLLALVINHPYLLAEVAEDLGNLEFPAADLDKVRGAIINVSASDPDLDSARLKRHLNEAGLADILEDVLGRDVLEEWRFARPEAPVQQARQGWEDTKARYLEPLEGAEIVSEERVLGADTTEEHWARLQKRLMDRAKRQAENSDKLDPGPGEG